MMSSLELLCDQSTDIALQLGLKTKNSSEFMTSLTNITKQPVGNNLIHINLNNQFTVALSISDTYRNNKVNIQKLEEIRHD